MKSFTVMTWTPDSIETWRDLRLIVGHIFKTTRYFDRVSIHARRDMSVEKPAAFTMMTWTHDSTHDWRDMSVIIGQDFETNSFFERDSIETWRDMSVIFSLIIKSFTVMTWTRDSTHDWRDMSVEAGLGYEATPCSDSDSTHDWRDMSVTKAADESSRPPRITENKRYATPPIIVNGHTT